MGNFITSARVPGTPPVKMSNGLTSVLLDVLVLAGCDFAESDWEKRVVYWLATKDQSRSGYGAVGFDVGEIGIETPEQRDFLLRMIDAARARHRWDALPFSPREDWIFDVLRRFRDLVASVPPGPAEGTSIPDELPTRGLCETHRVYLHERGCIVCNEGQ